ncbi:MAG: S8 family serine peptidase [Gammaproteobacteria bacterium]|nr:S8 family serine peptidase [Gammaproteobacteria bacterium]
MLNDGVTGAAELVDEYCRAFGSDSRTVCFGTDHEPGSLDESDAIVYEDLKLAIIDHRSGDDNSAAIASNMMNSESVDDSFPEFYAFVDAASPAITPTFADNADLTWGLQAIGVTNVQYTGDGVKVAVSDTGIDIHHPDLRNKIAAARSFVPGKAVDDHNGHGTHCCGTIAGARKSAQRPRYGVAPDASLVVAKVLSNRGDGRQRDILAGMIWAVQQGAAIISMSLVRAVRAGEPFDPAYERAAQFALNNGSLVIAAAGNESARRFGFIAAVGAPANSPSVMAVAAVDQVLDAADFSCGAINGNGGAVDIAAPGVGILSSWPLPREFRSIRGTSMACPHVAGVAALEIEANQGLAGAAVRSHLKSKATSLQAPQRDVGAGLVQA